MKKILILLLTLLNLNSTFAQSDLDYLLYYKISQYRTQNNLKPWKWDDNAWKVAHSHTYYQIKTGKMGHKEILKERYYAGERFTSYDILWTYVGENCAVIDMVGLDLDGIASRILELWKNSPPHNTLLLSSTADFAGISCEEGLTYKHYDGPWMYATLNVYKP